MKNYAYLVYVDPLANSNKYYEIKENDNGSLDVTYGRVGGRASFHHYSSYEKSFYSLVQAKESKGYTDVTALHSTIDVTQKTSDLSFKPIEHEKVNELIEMLAKSAREFVQRNYTIKANEITEKMVKEAQHDLDELIDLVNSSPNLTLWRFNEKLVQIFTDIPRKMKTVDDYTAKQSSDFRAIIDREQDMIDNIRGQIIKPQIQQSANKDETLLEAYGMTVRPVTYKEEDEITSHLGKDYDGRDVESRYVRAFKVENEQTRKAYEDFKASNGIRQRDCRLFYHGSKVENWLSIMKQGLSLNPNASVTGKMFGNGLYFAPDSRKSLNYMDTKGAHWNNGQRDTGYVAVYSVALGKCYMPTTSLGSSFNKNSLPNGCLSVYAEKNRVGLRNDEYVVYDQAQCTIKYLMEISARTREMDFSLNRKALINTMHEGVDSLIKIPNGVRAEIKLENFDFDKETWGSVILRNLEMCRIDASRIYMDYNAKQDTYSFTVEQSNGEILELHPTELGAFTKDDARFTLREMKKVFAKSEDEWKEIMRTAEKTLTGRKVEVDKKDETEKNRQQIGR